MPDKAVRQQTALQAEVLQRCLRHAADGGRSQMAVLLAEGRRSAASLALDGKDAPQTAAIDEAVAAMNRYAPIFGEHLPAVLTRAFEQAMREEPVDAASFAALSFDQLQLMDDAALSKKMALANLEKSAILKAEASLAELNTRICTVLGLSAVQPERNPFRPAIYVSALRELFDQVDASDAVRTAWLQLTGDALGGTLNTVYRELTVLLKAAGVAPASYAVSQAAGVNAGARTFKSKAPRSPEVSPVTRKPDRDETRLTLKALRQLLEGEAAPGGRPARSANEGSAQDIDLEPGFDHTVPAALEALQDMQQIDQVMARLMDRRDRPRSALGGRGRRSTDAVRDSGRAGRRDDRPQRGPDERPGGPAEVPLSQEAEGANVVYEQLRQSAQGVGQVVGLEVVALMIDNIVADARLLPPVQAVVRSLEPALLRLAMVDPRFFSDQAHPARQLLDCIVTQSIHFDSVDGPAFKAFMQPLNKVVGELQWVPIESAEPFVISLQALTQAWEVQAQQAQKQREYAVIDLAHAEQRNLLAKQIAQTIRERPDAQELPAKVMAFIAGPWCQAIAQEQLANAEQTAREAMPKVLMPAATPCLAVLDDLFWSVLPDLAGADPDRLVKLIPVMLGRLRAGLKAIEYPQAEVDAFLVLLMGFHQQALASRGNLVASRMAPLDQAPPDALPAAIATLASATAIPATPALTAPAVTPACAAVAATPKLWVAPSEVAASGFMVEELLLPDPSLPGNLIVDEENDTGPGVANDGDATTLPSGCWVDLDLDTGRIRTQLVWASPKGTLYLFCSAEGRHKSMSRESLDALMAHGLVHRLQPTDVLGSALDALAQTAFQNSISGNSP